MARELPRKRSNFRCSKLETAKDERDERLALLFRRWPELDNLELAELHRLWEDRVRLAKQRASLRR